MKKTAILLLIAACSIVKVYSQSYEPLLKEKNSWYQRFSSHLGHTYYWYYSEKDTLIDGNVYKQIWSSNDTSIVAFLREDVESKKVWRRYPGDTSDIMLYDFTLQIGDTFTCNYSYTWSFIVTSVSSVYMYCGYRNQITLTKSNDPLIKVYWIEGVGSPGDPIHISDFGGCPARKLICSYQNSDQIYYYFGATPCPVNPYLGIYDIDMNPVEIFPNPSSGQVNINISNITQKHITLNVFDIEGNLIYNQDINRNSTILDVSDYTKGVYILKIGNCEKVSVRKLIVL